MVAHDLLDKWSVVIGHCDLLNEIIEPNTEQARRLKIIRGIAMTAVEELEERQRTAEKESLAG